VQAALWTSTGDVTFLAEGSDSGMIGELPGAGQGLAAKTVTVPSLRLRDVLEREHVDLLKLDIEGAEALVLQDCEPALPHVAAMVMDLHEFDPRVRQAPAVFECLTRAGFTYSCDALVQQCRRPVASDESPFPAMPLVWTMTVRAWRE